MPLTDEQRSLLQLLLEGGQSYDDIGSLLGTGSDQVRERAREALTEIGGADPDAQVGLTDYLLGKADPIGRADVVRHLQNDPESNALASNILSQLRLLAPGADLPQIPQAKGGRRAAAPPSAASAGPGSGEPASPTPSGPSVRDRLSGVGGDPDKRKIAIAAVLAGLLVLAIVAAVFIFGGDDSGDGGDTQAGGATTATTADQDLVIVGLEPISGGSEAAGQAVFAQTQDQPLLQINLTGLEPAGQGQSYIVWLYNSQSLAFPIARDSVGQNGNLTGAAAIPQQILPLLGQFGCVDVSLASNQETQAALQEAVDGESLPAHSGQTVLRGQIPAAAGEQAPTGADAVCDQNAQGGAGAGAGGGAGSGGAGGGSQAP